MRFKIEGEYTVGYDDNNVERERWITTAQPAPAKPPLTRLQFLDRFTTDELAAIYTAAKTAVQIEIMLDKVKSAEFVSVEDPQTVAGVNGLESAGLIAAGRGAEILA